MVAPRVEIDLAKILHKASVLVTRLGQRGISVTGVTKATLGCPKVAAALLEAGVKCLGDARIENIKAMRAALRSTSMVLIRSPMLSQARAVVTYADASCNTELEVIRRLSLEAQSIGRVHGVILMVELGDLREGIMPEDVIDTVREVLSLPNLSFKGIGTNLAWALSGGPIGRINNLRLGEAILLGRETLNRQPIYGLHTDAIKLYAEVIESKIKPSVPIGKIAQTAFGEAPPVKDRGLVNQAILAIGQQDIDPAGLQPPKGMQVMAASSDHLILESQRTDLLVGTEVGFGLNYSALLRAMTSPFVTKERRFVDKYSIRVNPTKPQNKQASKLSQHM